MLDSSLCHTHTPAQKLQVAKPSALIYFNPLAQEREWINPTTDLFGSKNWNDYIDRVVEEGLTVGKAGYTVEDPLFFFIHKLFPVSVDGIPLVAAPLLRFLLYPLDGYLGT